MRHALLFSVFVIASCGLAYELIAGALSSYLLGDSVTQFSTVIGTYLFAMGAGSWLSKYITRDLIGRFIQIELMVGLLGGFSAIALFLVFTWLAAPFKLVLYLLVFGVGVLVGLEILLVMRILKRELAFKDLVSQVLTFDYLGALAVSIMFPLILAPHLGMVRTGLLFGVLNVVLPFLGPSTVRDTLALPVDRRGDPVQDITPQASRNATYVLRAVDIRANLLRAGAVLDEAALDKYSFQRDAYLQRRRAEIFDGNVPDPAEKPEKLDKK